MVLSGPTAIPLGQVKNPGWLIFLHFQVTNFEDAFGEIIYAFITIESYLPCVFLVASIIIPYPVHHLDEYILAIHQFYIIPLRSIIEIFLHQIRV